MKDKLKDDSVEAHQVKALKHDIRNQLSNIQLAIEQLRYEMPENANTDCIFYLDTMAMSCAKITSLLKD